MTAPTGSKRPTAWDDERLQAAFAARTSTVAVPADLVAVTLERLQATEPRRPRAGRLLPLVATLVLAVGAVGGGFALLSGPGGLTGNPVTFRDGPTAELRTLDAGTFALDFPADWLAYATDGAVASGGSIIAILTTQPIEDRCEGAAGADVNCAYEQRLDPGATRVFVGTGMYRGSTIFDRAPIENGSTSRLTVGGMPAILDEFDVTPDGYYLADQSATWQIALPTSLSTVVRLEFMAREPAVHIARAAVEAMMASFRFTPPPTPLPDDPAAAAAAARVALAVQAATFRQGFVPLGDPDAQTYLDCLGEEPDAAEPMRVRYGPGGALGWFVTVDCSWNVTADGSGFWRIDADWAWAVEGRRGLWSETSWIAADGSNVGSSSTGEPPPAGEPSPTPDDALPWPEPPLDPTVMTVDLVRDETIDRIVVTDHTDSLMTARPAVMSDIPIAMQTAPRPRLVRVADGGTVVLWDGSLCDSDFSITIEADDPGPPDRITVRNAEAGACRLALIRRAVWLDLGPVNVDSIVVRHDIAAAPTVPDELFGLKVIDVETALAIQARPDDDREIAVRGWLWMNRAVARCRISPETWMFGRDCGLWDTLRTTGGGGAEISLSFGPAVSRNPTAEASGREIVMIGHFDDRRSAACGPTFADRCADVFYVDMLWTTGAPISRDWTIGILGNDGHDRPLGSADAAAAVATSLLDDDPTRTMPHDGEVLSVGLLPGDQLATLEPTMRPSCGPSCDALFQAPAWVWHVTMLDRTLSEVRTFVIDDNQFDGRRSIIVREPTISRVVEYETMVSSADGPRIVLALSDKGLPVPIEEVDLPLQTP